MIPLFNKLRKDFPAYFVAFVFIIVSAPLPSQGPPSCLRGTPRYHKALPTTFEALPAAYESLSVASEPPPVFKTSLMPSGAAAQLLQN